MWTDAVQALMTLQYPAGTGVFLNKGSSTIAGKRNDIIGQLLQQPKLAWLLCLDSDMTPPADTIYRLLETKHDIVSALCVTRKPPFIMTNRNASLEFQRCPCREYFNPDSFDTQSSV